MKITKISQIEEIEVDETIDIEVSGNHLFYANDILTHNSSSDVDITDTSESFGLPATADLMVAFINTEQLENMNQIMVKQLKNRYNDINTNKRFTIGIDRSKMRLYDVADPTANIMSDVSSSSATSTVASTPFSRGRQQKIPNNINV